MAPSFFTIRGRRAIGEGASPYVMAEIGTNHNRDLETARALVRGVAESGADCAKFQIYEPHEIVSAGVRARDYGLDHLYGDISAQEMFARHLMTPKAWFPELKNLCHELGIDCMATIHGSDGIRWARQAGLDGIKIASMDHTNLPLLREMADTIDVPILISFGMAALEDVDAAMAILSGHTPGIGIFHCVAVYPPTAEELRLSTIPFFQERYGVPVGFSDHTPDAEAAEPARAVGASMFEKHVTLDRTQSGPDHPFALEMDVFASFTARVRAATPDPVASAGGVFVPPLRREAENARRFLKSVIATRDLPPGHIIAAADLMLARPGAGIPPSALESVIGRRVKRPVSAQTPLQWNDLDA